MKKTKIALICLYILQFIEMIVVSLMALAGHTFQSYMIVPFTICKCLITEIILAGVLYFDLKFYSKEICDYLYKDWACSNNFLWIGYTLGLIGGNTEEDKFVRKYLRIEMVRLGVILCECGLLLLIADNFQLIRVLFGSFDIV